MKVGWIGNYRRAGKSFDIAFNVCKEFGHELSIAGGQDTSLYLPRSEMPSWIRKQDVIFSTSAFEAHPLVMYEALACGVPFAIERSVGDGFINNVRGVAYYQGFSTKAINDSLEYIEENHSYMSREAVKEIHENWLWHKIKPQYEHMFKKVSKKDNPHVTFLIDSPGWAWDHMMKEIQEHVWENMTIEYSSRRDGKWYLSNPFEETDLVVNHQLHDRRIVHLHEENGNKPVIPVKKHILGVNGPAFVNQKHLGSFNYLVRHCKAVTTVSKDIMRYLGFLEKRLYYCTRGIDITKFHP